MGVQFGQNAKDVETKDIAANYSTGKSAVPRRRRESAADRNAADTKAALRELAQTYEQIADGLINQIHGHADNLKMAHALSRHLDWIGARARLVDSFMKAGDWALTYFCASKDAHRRLVPLAQLAAQNAALPGGLPVALFLMEKIDEELRLT